MKKTTILSILVVAVIITSFAVSGTYAKYTTSESITDKARVAKWDFTVGDIETIDLFKSSYMTDADGYSYVSADEKVVAPGTSGEYTFSIGGTAETNFRLGLSLGVDSYNNVKLTSTTTTTVPGEDGTETTETTTVVDYDPLRFSYSQDADGNDIWLTFDELKDALKDVASDKVYAAGETASAELTIKWKWAFDNTEADAAHIDNTKDTLLGNAIAKATDATSDEYKVMLTISVSAVQTKEQADSQKTKTPDTPTEGD